MADTPRDDNSRAVDMVRQATEDHDVHLSADNTQALVDAVEWDLRTSSADLRGAEHLHSIDTTEIGEDPLISPRFPHVSRGPILLVDDSQDMLDMYQVYMAHEGYHLLTAASGKAAIEIAREEHPALILMDLQMSGMSGAEAMQRLRADPAFNDVKDMLAC